MNMKKRKNFFIIILTIALFITTCCSLAFAAGVETWYGEWVQEPVMTVTNNNLTPVKTIGVSGTLHVACGVRGRPDLEPSGCPLVQVTMQIRDLNGNVLASGTVREDAFLPQIHLDLPVTQGQKIQIFFDVSSVSYNPNRNYRIADINYAHEIY